MQSDDTLALLRDVLWPEYCDKRNEVLGALDLTGFNKDKPHQVQYVADKIETFGIIDGQNDEGAETSHKSNLKENWRSRNNRNPVQQQDQIANNLVLFDTSRAMEVCYKHHLMARAHAGALALPAMPAHSVVLCLQSCWRHSVLALPMGGSKLATLQRGHTQAALLHCQAGMNPSWHLMWALQWVV